MFFRHGLLSASQAQEYGQLVQNYAPNAKVVYEFARSNFGVIAGPTGAGKDTLRNALTSDPKYIKILSTTSRPKRPGEKDGIDYHFRSLKFFQEGFDERRFLQVALVHNQQLSCLDAADISQLGTEQVGLSILIVQTEVHLRKLNSNMKTVFIVPPSLDELMKRLQSGRKVSKDELKRRTEAAVGELQIALKQDTYFCIVNDQINRARQLADLYFSTGQMDANENSKARATIESLLVELERYNSQKSAD